MRRFGGIFWALVILMALILVSTRGGEVKAADKPKPSVMTPLDQAFIVNLSDPGGRRYLKVKLVLECSNVAVAEEIKTSQARIRSNIIMLLTSKSYAQIATLAGKLKLRDQLVRLINRNVGSGQVRSIHFTDFVIQ